MKTADRAIVTDTDGARERGNGELSKALAEAAGGQYVPLSLVSDAVSREANGPVVLMGAGDFSSVLAALALSGTENKKDS